MNTDNSSFLHRLSADYGVVHCSSHAQEEGLGLAWTVTSLSPLRCCWCQAKHQLAPLASDHQTKQSSAIVALNAEDMTERRAKRFDAATREIQGPVMCRLVVGGWGAVCRRASEMYFCLSIMAMVVMEAKILV